MSLCPLLSAKEDKLAWDAYSTIRRLKETFRKF